MRVVGVTRTAKPGHPAAKGAGVALRIGYFEPATARGEEPDTFAAGTGDLSDAVANQGDHR